jgi:antitoxin (DNA-binding transcriptional repressor) of toxin-antitoxin stability system
MMAKYYGHHEIIGAVPMRTVSVAEAKAKLPSLLQAVEAGEKVIVTRRGKAIVELKAILPEIDPADPHGLNWLAERRAKRTPMLQSAAELIRSMREDGDS